MMRDRLSEALAAMGSSSRRGVFPRSIFLGAPAQSPRELTTVASSQGIGSIAVIANMDSFLPKAHLLHWTSQGPFLPLQMASTMLAISWEATPTLTARHMVS